jgi:hypothetical protein
MSGRRPDNERVQEPTISGDAFDRRDQYGRDGSASQRPQLPQGARQ